MRFCMVCGENITASEHKVNEIEHSDDQLSAVLICENCHNFHEKYLIALKTLGRDIYKSNQHEKQNLLYEVAHFLGKTKGKRVIVLYSKGDEISSDYGISYIPIDGDGYWKFMIKKELEDTVPSNMRKISTSYN